MSWIPVTEKLPPNRTRVLIAYTTGNNRQMVTIGWHCNAKEVESNLEMDEVLDEYDEETDTYYYQEQWVDESVESEYHYTIQNVVAWMPLPKYPHE